MIGTLSRPGTTLGVLLLVAACGGGGGDDGGAGIVEVGSNGGRDDGGEAVVDAGSGGGGGSGAAGTGDERIAGLSALANAAGDLAGFGGAASVDGGGGGGGSCGTALSDGGPDSDGDGLPDCLRGYPSLPVIGERGAPVDCASTLPCAWVSADGSIGAALIFADGHEDLNGRRGSGHKLATVATVMVEDRDATITLLDGAEARDVDGAAYTDRLRESPLDGPFGSEQRGSLELEALAGTPFRFRLLFEEEIERRGTLATLTIPFADGQARTEMRFENVPYGRAPSVDEDCAGSLPCTWISADGMQTVTVDSARVNLDDELEVGFTFITSEPRRSTTVNTGSSAVGDDFATYALARVESFGGEPGRNAREVTASTPAGEPSAGVVRTTFDEPTVTLTSLNRLSLQLYDASETVPFLVPLFRDVPVAR